MKLIFVRLLLAFSCTVFPGKCAFRTKILMYILKKCSQPTCTILVSFLTEEFEHRNANSIIKQFIENGPPKLNKMEVIGTRNCNCCNSLIPCYNVQMILE